MKKKLYCGTLRLRRGGPKDLKNIKKETKVGEIKAYQKEGVNVFIYREKKNKDSVTIITTLHNKPTNLENSHSCHTEINNNDISIFKSLNDLDTTQTQEITQINKNKFKPDFITDYNKYMKGVGLSDQMMKNYSTYRKNKRWINKMTIFVF